MGFTTEITAEIFRNLVAAFPQTVPKRNLSTQLMISPCTPCLRGDSAFTMDWRNALSHLAAKLRSPKAEQPRSLAA